VTVDVNESTIDDKSGAYDSPVSPDLRHFLGQSLSDDASEGKIFVQLAVQLKL
jgi:hypothetical protein